MSQRVWGKSLLIASVIALAISAVSIWVEWDDAVRMTFSLSSAARRMVLGAACVSYGLRILRFYLLLSQSGIPISLRNTR